MNSTLSLTCNINFPDISSITSYVFGTAFSLCGIMAAFENTISLVILSKPCMRMKSNSFLMSLALADALVGFVLCPLAAVQLIKTKLLTHCTVELSRVFLSITLCGVSAMMVALIAYDRYVLLSTFTNYRTKMTNKKVFVLILLSWFLPTIFQSFYFINAVLYLLFLCVLTIGPFIILTVSYVMMAKKIKEKERELQLHTKYLTDQDSIKEHRRERKNLKLAQKLTLLIVCYVVCLFPALVNFLAEIFIRARNLDKPVGLQIVTVFALLCASVNSVINPLIYVSKYPKFKKEFQKMFGFKNQQNGNSESSMATKSPVSKVIKT